MPRQRTQQWLPHRSAPECRSVNLGDSPVFHRMAPSLFMPSQQPASGKPRVSASQLLRVQNSSFQIRDLLSLYPTVFPKLLWLLSQFHQVPKRWMPESAALFWCGWRAAGASVTPGGPAAGPSTSSKEVAHRWGWHWPQIAPSC